MKLTRYLALAFLLCAVQAHSAITHESSASVACNTCTPTSSSDAITYPANVDEDDLVVLTYCAEGGTASTTTTWTNPTGYTLIYEHKDGTGSDRNCKTWYRVAPSGGLSGSLDVQRSGSNNHEVVAIMDVYDGVDTTTPLDASVTSSQYATAQNDPLTPDPAAITTVNDNAIVYTILYSTSNDITGWTAPSGYTLRANNLSGINEMAAAEKLVSPAGSENPGTWNNSGAAVDADQNMLTIALRAATGGTGTTVVNDDTVDVTGSQDIILSITGGSLTTNSTLCEFGTTDDLAVTANAGTVTGDCDVQPTDFESGADLASTPIGESVTILLRNATETAATDTMTFNIPSDADNFYEDGIDCDPDTGCDNDSLMKQTGYSPGFNVAVGDDLWVEVTSGLCASGTLSAGGVFMCGVGSIYPIEGVIRTWDDDGDAWGTGLDFELIKSLARGPLKRGVKVGIKSGASEK